MRRSFTALSLMLAVAACENGNQVRHIEDAAPDAHSNWDDVRAHYGVMSNVAGLGATDNSGTSEWLTSFAWRA